MIIQSKETEASHSTHGKETANDAGKVFKKLYQVSRGPMTDFDLGYIFFLMLLAARYARFRDYL